MDQTWVSEGNIMKKRGVIARCLLMVTQVSITLLAPIIFCTALGVWLDGRFGWHTTVVLLILGVIAGGKNAYTLVKGMIKEAERESTYDR